MAVETSVRQNTNSAPAGALNHGLFHLPALPNGAVPTLALMILCGGITVVAYARQVPGATVSVDIMIAGVSVALGGLAGFLFGVPRALHADAQTQGPAQDGSHLRVNTNLEQISDWLTKILVGVGLTQIAVVPDRLGALAAYLAPAFGKVPGSSIFAGAAILYFTINGFLLSYLWTRLYLSRDLDNANGGILN